MVRGSRGAFARRRVPAGGGPRRPAFRAFDAPSGLGGACAWWTPTSRLRGRSAPSWPGREADRGAFVRERRPGVAPRTDGPHAARRRPAGPRARVRRYCAQDLVNLRLRPSPPRASSTPRADRRRGRRRSALGRAAWGTGRALPPSRRASRTARELAARRRRRDDTPRSRGCSGRSHFGLLARRRSGAWLCRRRKPRARRRRRRNGKPPPAGSGSRAAGSGRTRWGWAAGVGESRAEGTAASRGAASVALGRAHVTPPKAGTRATGRSMSTLRPDVTWSPDTPYTLTLRRRVATSRQAAPTCITHPRTPAHAMARWRG